MSSVMAPAGSSAASRKATWRPPVLSAAARLERDGERLVVDLQDEHAALADGAELGREPAELLGLARPRLAGDQRTARSGLERAPADRRDRAGARGAAMSDASRTASVERSRSSGEAERAEEAGERCGDRDGTGPRPTVPPEASAGSTICSSPGLPEAEDRCLLSATSSVACAARDPDRAGLVAVLDVDGEQARDVVGRRADAAADVVGPEALGRRVEDGLARGQLGVGLRELTRGPDGLSVGVDRAHQQDGLGLVGRCSAGGDRVARDAGGDRGGEQHQPPPAHDRPDAHRGVRVDALAAQRGQVALGGRHRQQVETGVHQLKILPSRGMRDNSGKVSATFSSDRLNRMMARDTIPASDDGTTTGGLQAAG